MLIVLLIARFPVALALMTVSFGGIALLVGLTPAFGIVMNTPYSFVASWTMSAVPMFLLMGFISYHAGLTTGLFEAAKVLLRKIPGGLAISSIFACSGFAAVSGSSLATAAAMGRIAIPEIVAAGYKPSIAAGSIAAGGDDWRIDPAVDPDDNLRHSGGNFGHASVCRWSGHRDADGIFLFCGGLVDQFRPA